MSCTFKISQKGGPGSGNFGHEGRPGLVGGSTISGLAVATYDWISNHEAFAWEPQDKAQEDYKEGLLLAAANAELPKDHFGGLSKVALADYMPEAAVGYYIPHMREIYLAPVVAEAALGQAQSNKDWASSIFIHEMGHHVSDTHMLWLLDIANKAMSKALPPLLQYGLRMYSMKNKFEFAADSYHAWKRANMRQKDDLYKLLREAGGKLANFWDLLAPTLDDLFTHAYKKF